MMRALLLLSMVVMVMFGASKIQDEVEKQRVYDDCVKVSKVPICMISILGNIIIDQDENLDGAWEFLHKNYHDMESYTLEEVANYAYTAYMYLVDEGYPVDNAMFECSNAAKVYAKYYDSINLDGELRSDIEYTNWGKVACDSGIVLFKLGVKESEAEIHKEEEE